MAIRAVAWCAGFGRLGGIVGPVAGGMLVGAGLDGAIAFLIFAVLAVLGAVVTAFVPRKPAPTPEVATKTPATAGL